MPYHENLVWLECQEINILLIRSRCLFNHSIFAFQYSFKNMSKSFKLIYPFMIMLVAVLLQACNDTQPKDTLTSGNIKISVDETYKPVMENQLKVFLARNPDAKITVEYKPESECFDDYFNDSTRVIFVTRELTPEEIKFAESKNIVSQSKPMARDAVAFITSKNIKNPNFKLADIKMMLQGKNNPKQYQFVFDNKGSSTVRYINDSILQGKKMGTNIFATHNCEEVIDYVANNDLAIGMIGVSWVANHADSVTETFLEKVNIAGIWPDNDSMLDYKKPYQAYIGLKEYPCTRNFYFISKETWVGLGSGFNNYLCRDGQLVFKQAKMFPLQVQVFLRTTNVSE
jgi:phosphate transport system substrate-binding protein